jgi:hypothetical protein
MTLAAGVKEKPQEKWGCPLMDDVRDLTEEREARGRSLRRAAYLTAGVGIVYAVLFLLSFWLVSRTPGARASDAELTNFYASGRGRVYILVGLYLMPFAGIAFIWFIVALRMWIGAQVQRENALLANIQLVSGIIFVALFFSTAATYAASATMVELQQGTVSPAVARQLPLLGSTLMFVFAVRMAAMFVFTTTNIGRGAGILPRWFVLLSYAVGLFLLLSATFSYWLVLVFPIWVLVLCGFLLLRARRIPADAMLPSRVIADTVPP